MTDPAPETTPADRPPRPLGTPVGGGQKPAMPATGAMVGILNRIDDPELRKMLETPKGGQLARAVAGELDDLRSIIASQGQERPQGGLMTDAEATELDNWLTEHFTLAGHTPKPDERLVGRVMLTLYEMYKQLQKFQRTLAERPAGGTPIE